MVIIVFLGCFNEKVIHGDMPTQEGGACLAWFSKTSGFSREYYCRVITSSSSRDSRNVRAKLSGSRFGEEEEDCA